MDPAIYDFDLIQYIPDFDRREAGVRQELDKTVEGLLEVDIVLPKGVVCIDDEVLAHSRNSYYGGVRLRTAQGKLKIEHRIIEGVRAFVERLLAGNPDTVRAVIPGVIRQVRDAKGEVKVRITVPVQNGWKAIALSAGQRQELFISTTLDQEQLGRAIAEALVQ